MLNQFTEIATRGNQFSTKNMALHQICTDHTSDWFRPSRMNYDQHATLSTERFLLSSPQHTNNCWECSFCLWNQQSFSRCTLHKYTDCQDKKAQVKDDFGSWPMDARLLDSVLTHESHTHVKLNNKFKLSSCQGKEQIFVAGKMKTKAYSHSHSPRNWAVMTNACTAIEQHCLVSFGCLLWAPVFLPQKHIYGLSLGYLKDLMF